MRVSPIDQAALFLSVLAVAAVSSQLLRDTDPLVMAGRFALHLLATAGMAGILFRLFVRLSGQRKAFGNTLVTALIIFLVLAPPEGPAEFLLIALVTALAMGIKFFVSFRGRPLLNPAAGALLGILLVGGLLPEVMLIASWWGASFLEIGRIGDYRITLALLLLIGWVAFGLRPWRKYPAFFAFVLTVAAGLGASVLFAGDPAGQGNTVLRLLLDPTILFFASVMVIEPKTSPQPLGGQMLFGSGVGLLFVLWHPVMPFSLPGALGGYYDLTALVAGNLVFAAFFALKGRKPSRPAAASA